jgi:hypothetical protein
LREVFKNFYAEIATFSAKKEGKIDCDKICSSSIFETIATSATNATSDTTDTIDTNSNALMFHFNSEPNFTH